jgi:hypothetical protein
MLKSLKSFLIGLSLVALAAGIMPINYGSFSNIQAAQAGSGSCYRRDTWYNSPAVCRFYNGYRGVESTGGVGMTVTFYDGNGGYVAQCYINPGQICDLGGTYRATQIKVTPSQNNSTSYFNTF